MIAQRFLREERRGEERFGEPAIMRIAQHERDGERRAPPSR